MTPRDIPSDESDITDLHLDVARAVNRIVADKIEEEEPHAQAPIQSLRSAADELIGDARTVLYRDE